MKALAFITAFTLASFAACGQGTLIYDQQSADESGPREGGLGIQSNEPIGQSFTPTNSSVGFIRLYLYDAGIGGNSVGATVHVNLLGNSLANGTVLSSTDPVFMPDGFNGFANFFFASPVSVTPGVVYYFQSVVESGDPWGVNRFFYNYSGGTAFYGGVADPNTDLWFREGIVVPEPSPAWLILVGGGALVYVRLREIKKRSLT